MSDARPDLVTSFFAYHRTRRDDLFWAWEEVTAVVHSDPEAAWPLVRRLVGAARGDAELYYVAAGPLEDLIALHGPELLARITADAEADEPLRRALGGVWGRERIAPDVWRAIQALAIPEGPLGAHPYEVAAPPGWILDDSRGRAEAIVVPQGEDPGHASAVMLVDAEWRDATADLATHVERVLNARRAEAPELSAEDFAPIAIASGARVPTLRLHADAGAWGLAFVEAPLVVYELVIAARSEAALEAAWPAFVRFAATFRVGESA